MDLGIVFEGVVIAKLKSTKLHNVASESSSSPTQGNDDAVTRCEEQGRWHMAFSMLVGWDQKSIKQ